MRCHESDIVKITSTICTICICLLFARTRLRTCLGSFPRSCPRRPRCRSRPRRRTPRSRGSRRRCCTCSSPPRRRSRRSRARRRTKRRRQSPACWRTASTWTCRCCCRLKAGKSDVMHYSSMWSRWARFSTVYCIYAVFIYYTTVYRIYYRMYVQ